MKNFFITKFFLNNYFLNSPLISSNKINFNINNCFFFKSFTNFLYITDISNFKFNCCKFSIYLKNTIQISNNIMKYIYISSKYSFLNTGSALFEDCIFNNIISNEMGGAILVNNNFFYLYLVRTGFYNCITTYYGYSAGGFTVRNGLNVSLLYCCFDFCLSIGDTSCFQISYSSSVKFSNCLYNSFINNYKLNFNSFIILIIILNNKLIFNKNNISHIKSTHGIYIGNCPSTEIFNYCLFNNLTTNNFLTFYQSNLASTSIFSNLYLKSSSNSNLIYYINSNSNFIFKNSYIFFGNLISDIYINGHITFINSFFDFLMINSSKILYNDDCKFNLINEYLPQITFNSILCWNLGKINSKKQFIYKKIKLFNLFHFLTYLQKL